MQDPRPDDPRDEELLRHLVSSLRGAIQADGNRVSFDEVLKAFTQAAEDSGFPSPSPDVAAIAQQQVPIWEAQLNDLLKGIESDLPGGRDNPKFREVLRERVLAWAARVANSWPHSA